MRKRYLFLAPLLAVAACLTACAPTAPTEEEMFLYQENTDQDSYSVIGSTEPLSGNIELPAEHNGLPVTGVGRAAFMQQAELTALEIPLSIENIQTSAFASCEKLGKVVFHEGLERIGESAFRGCYSLEQIALPASLRTIGARTFWGCTGMKDVTIGENVHSIGERAFYECESLENVMISDIDAWCEISFANAYSNPLYFAENLVLDGEVVTTLSVDVPVAFSAFRGYGKLEHATFGAGVTRIGGSAFYDCDGMVSIVMGKETAQIGSYAFEGCTALESVFYQGTEAEWNMIEISEHNEPLTEAAIYYYMEEQPSAAGNYWHYEEGQPVVWNV